MDMGPCIGRQVGEAPRPGASCGFAIAMRLRRLVPTTLETSTSESADPETTNGAARTIFRVWVIIYGLVGAQMGWILRPFIGAPDQAFAILRPRDGNVFLSVVQSIRGVMGW